MIEDVNHKGMFSASQITKLLAGKTGATRGGYIYDLALEMIGCDKPDFDNQHMKHGRNNQMTAFQQCIKPLYKDAVWFDQFIKFDERCGASPDVKIDDLTPCEIKCPYYIDTYAEQILKVPKAYYEQVQMQIITMGGDFGLICFFLSRPEPWGLDESWTEYPFALPLRHTIIEIKKDEAVCEDILTAIDKYTPIKNQLAEKLKAAKVMTETEFFYEQYNGYKLRPLRNSNNYFNVEPIRVGKEFYYYTKK